MKVALNSSGVFALAAVAAGVLVLVVIARKGGAVAAAVNPADADNLVNRAVTGAGQTMSGDSAWTLGGWIYELTHAPYEPNPAPLSRAAPLTPNPLYSGVNRAGQALSGARAWTLGSWIYDLTHEDYKP